MKTSLFCGAVLAMLGVTAAPSIGQTQPTTDSIENNYVQTSKVIGTKVKTAQGEEIGVVKDVVLERGTGCLAYTILSTGGGGTRVTGQSKLVAVPWSVYTVAPDASYLTVTVERDRIYNAPVFDYSHINDATYISNVYSHFGVGAGVNLTTGSTTATTGATTQAQGGASVSPTASPGASASVSPRASASPNGSASAAPNASASPSASADAKATASPKSGNRSRGKSGESQTSSRRKGEETSHGANDESTSEATGSSSGKKPSTRKSTSEDSSAESEDTPSSKKSSHKKGASEGTSETAPTPGGEQE